MKFRKEQQMKNENKQHTGEIEVLKKAKEIAVSVQTDNRIKIDLTLQISHNSKHFSVLLHSLVDQMEFCL